MDDNDSTGSTDRPPKTADTALEWLTEELPRWRAEGLIREEQARLILARYGLAGAETTRTVKHQRIAQALAFLGVALVGAGVILVVGANWEAIPRIARLLGLMALIAAFYGTGFHLAHARRTYPGTGRALILLGSLVWGASIFLVAQTYHAGAEGGEKAAVLVWLLGVLPLAYVLRSPEHAALSAGLLILVYNWYLADHFAGFPTLPAHLLLNVLLGIALYSAGCLHRLRDDLKPLAGAYLYTGLLVTLGSIYLLSFDIYGGTRGHAVARPDAFHLAMAAASAGPAVLLSLAVLLASAGRAKADRWEGTCVFAAAVAGAGLYVLGAAFPSLAGHRYPGAAAAANAVLLALETGLVALGWQRLQPALVNLGLAAFFIHLLTRYFDVIGRMLTGGFAFIGAGLVLLLAGTLLERQRKRLLRRMAERRAE